MSQKVVKATNRQIRRAFGEEALDTLNQQGETLQSIVIPRLMTAGKTLGEHDTRLGALEDSRAEFGAFKAHWTGLTRWQRLRWMAGF